MEEKTITKCPHCGAETHMQGVTFCPFCGNSLLGETIVATNQSIKEEVNELEDSNLKKNGAEYPTMLKDIILTIVGILLPAVYSFIMFIGGIVDLLRDKDMVKAIVLIIWSLIGMIVCLVFVLVYTLNHVDDFRQRKLFKEGNKAAFDAEVRSYGSERCVPFGKENG